MGHGQGTWLWQSTFCLLPVHLLAARWLAQTRHKQPCDVGSELMCVCARSPLALGACATWRPLACQLPSSLRMHPAGSWNPSNATEGATGDASAAAAASPMGASCCKRQGRELCGGGGDYSGYQASLHIFARTPLPKKKKMQQTCT